MDRSKTDARRPALLGAAILGLLVCWGCGDRNSSAESQGPGGRGERPATAVQTARVERGSIARSLVVTGIVEPIRVVGVNSQLSGALTEVRVEEGTSVARGQVLARLDDRELQSQLTAAEAAFQVAEAAYERATQLRDRQVITLPEYERDRAGYAAAKAQLDQLRTRVEYATIVSPMNGVITDKRVEPGDVVATQTRLLTVADLSTMVVQVQVSELDVVSLVDGQSVEIGLDAFPGRALDGTIRRVFPAADPATRLVPVEVALSDGARQLARPGFLARATFALGTRDGVLLVPASALAGGSSSESVFVVEEGKAVRRRVTTGLISQGRVEILDGLREGEIVVTVGNNTLQDGASVRILEAGTRSGDAGSRPGGTP